MTGLNPTSEPFTVLVCLRNYDMVSAVQMAFDWPESWVFWFPYFNCRYGQISSAVPMAAGPVEGTLRTEFNYLSGGALTPIGELVFQSASAGCLSIVESAHEFGNYVYDGFTEERTALRDENEGRICIGFEPRHTCECVIAVPVEATTWGEIKATWGGGGGR